MRPIPKLIAIVLFLGLVAAGGYYLLQPADIPEPDLSDFETPGMSTSTEQMVRLDTPEENATITSPLAVSGEARGQWYFEAQFNVVLADWGGRIIMETPATASGTRMTPKNDKSSTGQAPEFVPFEAELEFDSPYAEGGPDFMRRGSLILQKANPSGLPENDAALEIPVWFAAE